MKFLYSIFLLLIFLLTLPLWVLVGLIVLIGSGWPIFYKQLRIGKNNKPFLMYKFRTMIVKADKTQRSLYGLNEAHGPVFKIHNDPRFTRVGKFIAHTGLDELPQLINVLHGDMAFFGPRPLPVEEAKKLKPWQKKRHAILPGIISPWILNGYHAQSFDAWMKSDIDYIQKKNVTYDIHLMLRAIKFLTRLMIREIN
jgi:lipopolysaccharide/colanic/teichoic acid biosynthesis glycosyltransferase